MTPPSKDLSDDIPVWGLEPNGKYSVKSGYLMALGMAEEPNRAHWSTVWKWEGPQRIRQFLWIVSNNKLLTNAERYRRHMTDCSDCGVCLATPETSLHFLRDCAVSREVWGRFQDISEQPDFFTTNMEAWWFSYLSRAATAKRFGVICWVIWKCRNERIFEGLNTNDVGIDKRCRYWMDLSKEAFSDYQVLRGNERPQRYEKKSMAAAGGVLRNWEGRTVDAFTFNLGKCSITRAELTGAVTGIERAWDMGVRELTVQLDSLCAIKLLSDPGSTNHQHMLVSWRDFELL
ncbi:Putative ribonuclease H protein At1g65750 [Linum perenne]